MKQRGITFSLPHFSEDLAFFAPWKQAVHVHASVRVPPLSDLLCEEIGGWNAADMQAMNKSIKQHTHRQKTAYN